MAERDYRRLTRPRLRRRGVLTALSPFATRSSLWLGKEHLLNIDSSRYSDRYKRFYFRDIQAITICRTSRRAIWNWILAGLLLSCPAVLVLVRDSNIGTVLTIASTSILGLFLLINNILGTACVCYLRTAVQIEELPSLNRIGRTRRVLGLIRPLIETVQGQLAPEEASARMREMLQSVEPAGTAGTGVEPL